MKSKILFYLMISALAVAFWSCETDNSQQLEKKNWQMVWSDEFNGNSGEAPNSANWTYDIGSSGWGNQELQYYTNRPENVQHDGNGNLVITARKENFNGAQYTSARIKSQGLQEFKYGRIEARLKTPYGPGIWPAFWMLGSNINSVSWPQCGEIDIMELKGQLPSIISGTLHGPGYSASNAITKSYGLQNGRFDNDFHLFAVEWNESSIDFFVDDFMYQRIDRSKVNGEWVFDQSFFLIFNIAVGGNYVGYPTIQTPFPQKMTIDYVRVYKQL